MPQVYTTKEIEKHLNSINWKFIMDIKGDFKNKTRRKIHCLCSNDHLNIRDSSTCLQKNMKCLQCISITTEKCHEIASEKGLKFLSEKYEQNKFKYLWECDFGHKWESSYDTIKKGKGCYLCTRIPFNDYCKVVEGKGGKVITEEKDYKNVRSRIEYMCKLGHKCNIEAYELLRGQYCGECCMSTSERVCRKIFEYLFNVSFPKNRDFIYPETNNFIELDGYNKDLKIAFEYNGIQHYKRVDMWQTQEEFEKYQERDKFVLNLCKEQNIKLIIIPYTIKHNDLYTFISKQFPDNNFPEKINYSLLKLESYGSQILEEIKQFVKDKYNGKILSEIYINHLELLDCECEKGHRFQRASTSIKQGVFCTCCGGKNALFNISEFCKKYDYTLISKYTNRDTDMEWKCNNCNENFINKWKNFSQLRQMHECEI